MTSKRTLLLSTLAVVTLGLSLSSALVLQRNESKPNLTESTKIPYFSPRAKSLLNMLSSTKLGLLGGVSFQEILKHLPAPAPQDYPEYLYIDYYYVELRQLLTQSIKFAKTTTLPELDWSEHYDFCVWIWCFDFTLVLKSAETKLIGTQSITSTNEVNTSTFTNTFTVPHVEFSSPNWMFQILTGYGDETTWEGYHLTIDNLTIQTNLNYKYEEGVGIIVSTLEIDFNIQNMTSVLDCLTEADMEGVIGRDGPFVVDLTESAMDDWNSAKDEYTIELLTHINCLLTGQRAFPAKCVPSSDENYNEYYHFLVTQIIQNIGLGALLT